MNVFNIMSEIEKTDPEIYDRVDDRRGAIKNASGFAYKVAALTVPFLFGSILKKAYGQTTASVVDVIKYALTLEYLEAEFYTKGVAASGLIPAADVPAFTTIRNHENAHVAFLQTTLSALGGGTLAKPNFDFTGSKNGTQTAAFPGAFTSYPTFLAMSQAFEDTGVRAYKGQAANLMSNKNVLQAALQIHSVEARHAAHVRSVRRAAGASLKPWITGADSGGVSGGNPNVAGAYGGEDNVTQAGVAITNIGGQSISAAAASEAFDEPLTMAQVLPVVSQFIY